MQINAEEQTLDTQNTQFWNIFLKQSFDKIMTGYNLTLNLLKCTCHSTTQSNVVKVILTTNQ